MADAPFRLLHLPPELQLMVYQKYFEGSELTITEYSHETEVFVFRDLPSLNLELVSRNVSLDARSLRDRCTSRDLRVEYPDFIKSHLGKFIGDKRYAWVRGHIEALLIDEATYSLNAARVPLELQPDWQTLVVRCSRLTEVVIRFREHRVVVTVPAVASATNKLRKKALREVMRHALDGSTQVDDLHETTIKAYQLPDLAQRLESLDRDGWVSVDFPSCWHTNNDGILFFMVGQSPSHR